MPPDVIAALPRKRRATSAWRRNRFSSASENSSRKCFASARNLEFEEAARIRDEITVLRKAELGLPDTKAG